jgi:NTP pyrophosphatase (non-canonical NTP hydrolase)
MNFDEYQKQAITTDVFGGKPQPVDSHAFLSKLLGLVGEAGETAEKFKKIFRDKAGVMTEEDKKEIVKELGDVLWYLSVICTYLDIKLADVAEGNLEKVLGRKARGVTKGKGDNR